ncbi:chemotaxis protein CheW [Myxococcota bacterium]|nr:chemotaxis protein CheW [Myxococcota bacterium]
MTFRLASEAYGLEILQVREIIGVLPMTRVPNKPDSVRGVINLRGRVIPVLDLRRKFGLPIAEITDQSVIIVVQVNRAEGAMILGLLVDEVLEVLKLAPDQVDGQPSYGSGADRAEFIRGIGKTEQKVVFLVDLEKVLTNQEASSLAASGGAS